MYTPTRRGANLALAVVVSLNSRLESNKEEEDTRQSSPDSGLGVQVKVLQTFSR